MIKIPLTILALFSLFHSPLYAKTYLFVGSSFPYILEEGSDGNIQGVGADIAKEIVNELGHKIKIELYPWARAQRMVEIGQADVIIGPYKTQERSQFMDYSSKHFYTDRIVLYTKIDNSFVWDGEFSNLQGYMLGTTRGWSYGVGFDNIKDTLTLEPGKDLCTNFKKMMIGRVAIVPATHRAALVCIEELNLHNKVKLHSPDLQSTNGHYGFSKKKKLTFFKDQFDKKLKEMIANGRVLLINQRYRLLY